MFSERKINVVAKAIYETHHRELPNDRDRIPPVWQNASPDIKKWVRAQAINAIRAVERYRDTGFAD